MLLGSKLEQRFGVKFDNIFFIDIAVSSDPFQNLSNINALISARSCMENSMCCCMIWEIGDNTDAPYQDAGWMNDGTCMNIMQCSLNKNKADQYTIHEKVSTIYY